jgi:hypothetical protein
MNNEEILKMAQNENPEYGEYESVITKKAAGYGTIVGLIILAIMVFAEMFLKQQPDFGKPAIVFSMCAVANIYESRKIKSKRKLVLGIIEITVGILCILAYLGALMQ